MPVPFPAGATAPPTTAPRHVRNVINGESVEGIRTFDKFSPLDGSLIAQVHEAGPHEVDRAVASARAALSGPWGRMTVTERATILRRVADIIERRFDDLVAAEVADTGKPEALARELDVARAAANFRAFADVVSSAGLDSYLTEISDGRRALNYAVRKPLGVVAVIVPWNLPLLLLTWKLAPALATGNTVVVKPSEETPSSATLLAEVLLEAGVPAGAVNIVHGFGEGSAGEYLTTHPGIDGVTFTGETSTGSAIMRAVAPRVRPVSFELGGKNAALVFADADLDAAIAGLARSTFLNTGQVCLCTERIYVERSIFEEVSAGLTEHAGACASAAPRTPRPPPGHSSRRSTARKCCRISTWRGRRVRPS